MSAETLRRAAALMRERAEACVTDSDGARTWRVGPPDHYGNTPTVECDLPGDPEPYTLTGGCSDQDAEHIASWHPEVALAVADWLDATAQAHDHDANGAIIDVWSLPGIDKHPALAVARAYLGEAP